MDPQPDTQPTELPATRREVVLDAAPAEVWAELSSGDALAGWLADEVDLDEVRSGATGTVRDGDGPTRPVRVDEVVPGRRLGLTWRDGDGRETVVELALTPVGVGSSRTRLVVVEVPVATLRLVAPAAARLLAAAPPAGGAGPVARALAGVR